MKVGVVGATGLVGRHVVEALACGGRHRIIATHHVRQPFEAGNTNWLKCDLRKRARPARYSAAWTRLSYAPSISTSAVLSRDPTSSVLTTLRIMTNALEAAAVSPSACRSCQFVYRISCSIAPGGRSRHAQGDPPAQWFGVGWMHRYVEQQLSWYVSASA